MPSLPLIDFSTFYNGTEAERAQLASTITSELQKHGAMRLINTRISAEKIEEGFKWVNISREFLKGDTTDNSHLIQGKKFFSLPLEEKEAIPNERNANPQRGWSYVGSENTSKLDLLHNDGLEDEKVCLPIYYLRNIADTLSRFVGTL
jgi:isopenicillin N synthase-like dioxygenase